MPRKPDPATRILDAALRLAAARGWRATGLGDVAAEAGVSLAELLRAYPSKAAMLEGFLTRIDAEVLEGTGEPIEGESARDRLFDVLMRRFDALRPHRDALRAIRRDLRGDPFAALAASPRFARSMAWMLEAAGLDSSGLRGMVRVKGLAALYLSTVRVFLEDDSEDLSRTMAALDARLRRAEALMETLGRFRRPRAPGREDGESAPAGEAAPS